MSTRGRLLAWLAGPLVMVAVLLPQPPLGSAAPGPGGQGTDTSLPATASQVVVSGRGRFASLEIRVNQTESLTNQAVSITWTGAAPTRSGPGRFGSRFVQIMQCWGDDDGTVPGNPGPPPEQCEQGAFGGTPAGPPVSLFADPSVVSRIISRSTWSNFDPAVGFLDTRNGLVWRPFRAVDGSVVNVQFNPRFNPTVVSDSYWLNPDFNNITTNEIAGALTGPNGTGAELFEVVTGLQSSGLGCGQRVQPVAGGTKIPQCWIVVVPRGAPIDENAGTPFEQSADLNGVVTSPLSPSVWANRIAIPIEFKPIDSPCSLADVERRIAGSELVLPAVSSWQPALCAGGSLPPYSYAPVGDAAARQQLAAATPGAPGMVAVSSPLKGPAVDPTSPAVYAPLSVSGVVIGFNVERNPKLDAPAAAQQLAGVRIAELNLTPRLVAKLLTQSYRSQVAINLEPDFAWVSGNPDSLVSDPDFVRFNPEFALLDPGDRRTFSGLQLPSGTSDAARQVWEWVFADAEAHEWLNGVADEWGMRVNPVYASVATVNSTGAAFGDPPPSTFPKADPFCYQGPSRGTNNSIVPPLLCGTDWMPYHRGFGDTARVSRIAFDGARIVDNPSALTSSQVWARQEPQYLGRRSMLAITDTPSASRFGLQMARLSRAGDNGPGRVFVAADNAGLAAGAASMSAGSEPTVLEPNPAASAPTAYPLTAIAYAAIKPLSLDAQARAEYAAFIDYASGPGQVVGFEVGQLPPGYVSLPESMQAQAASAANLVRTMVAPTPNADTVPASVPTSPQAPVGPAVPATPASPAVPEGTAVVAEESTGVQTNPVTVRLPNSSTRPASVSPASAEPVTEVAPVVEAPVAEAVPLVEAAPVVDVATDPADVPAPSGAAAILTPIVDLARSRYAVSGLGVVALSSALGALEISKRPRRRGAGDPDDAQDPDVGDPAGTDKD